MRKLRALPSGLALSLAALVFSGLGAGCGGGSIQQGPSDALRAYARALEEGRADDAYRMLSDEAKRTMSLEAFRRAVQDHPLEAVEVARALARPATDPVILATLTVPNGEELVLVFEGDRWRIDAAAVDLYGQQTPRQALLGFLRAYDRKRWDVLLRYIPQAEIEGLGESAGDEGKLTADKLKVAWEGDQKEQVERIVQAIRAALPTSTIEETGESAAMAYGAGGTVAFVREGGVWKIKEL